MSRNNPIFKYLLLAILFGCLLLCFVGCKTCTPIVETIEKEKMVEVHTRDTAIITKADSAQLQLLLRCDSANNVLIDKVSTANGERLQLEMKLQKLLNGYSQLSVDCKEDSLRNIIQMQDSIITSITSHTIVQQVETIPKFYRNCTIAMWILVAAIAIGITIRILIKVYLHK